MNDSNGNGNGSTITDRSPAQRTLDKIDNRNRVAIMVSVILLAIAVVFNMYQGFRLQSVIDENQEQTVKAREANVNRQNETKAYIKCVLLIRFTSTPESLVTKEGVTKALDVCAASTEP